MQSRRIIRQLFSTMSDPYYILGVDRSSPFSEIKVAYYKLASEYHPDKNQSPEANKKFILIKEAFQSIKMQKGLMKPQNLYSSNEAQSMRPNPQKFTSDDSEQVNTGRDYRVERQKTQGNDQYQTFNTSFRTIHDISDIKIKVQKGEMKDPSSRFNLQQYKVKIQKYSNNGVSYIFIIGIGFAFIFTMVNTVLANIDSSAKKSALNSFNKIHQRKTLLTETQAKIQLQIEVMSISPDIIELENAELKRKKRQGKRIHRKQEVISESQIQSV